MANNRKYWAERREKQIANRIKDDKKEAKELEKMYNHALAEIKKEMFSFYAKYANKNGMTMEEARKMADEMDVKAFAEKARQYVKYKDFSDRANAELALYNLKMKISRLELLEEQINLLLCELYNEETAYLYEQFNKAAIQESAQQAGILAGSARLSRAEMVEALNASFLVGTFSDNIWADKNKLKKKLMQAITRSIVLGENPNKLAGDFAKEMGVSRAEAVRILRTEIANVATATAKKSYEETKTKRYQNLIEPSACKICKEMGDTSATIDQSDKIYNVSEMVAGVNAPPFHPNCRCATVPYIEDLKELDEMDDIDL